MIEMGGRGASSKSSSFAVKRGGSIFQYRKIQPSDNLMDSHSGLMFREFGTKNWRYTRETRANIAKNNKLYSLKDKTVNPKKYINSDQRWKNNDLKTKLKNRRAGTQVQATLPNSNVVGYKNGRRIIDKSYKRLQMKYALGEKRLQLQDAKARMTPLFGKPTKAEKRRVQKLERGIKKLERELRS